MRKIYKINILCLLFLIFSKILVAQTLRGVVMSETGDTLAGAVVMWEDQSEQTVSGGKGQFELRTRPHHAHLQVSFVGFVVFEVEVPKKTTFLTLKLKSNDLLETVTVQSQRGHAVSTLATRSLETIGQGELRKDACCNLSESFERSGSVDVSYQDGVTGAKEIQMLGLRGIYTQLQVENRQSYNGLATPFALEYLPGSWLESIQISKGVGSVVNGFSAMTGSVNAELQKPTKDKKMFLNLYGDGFQRFEANLHLNKVVSPKFSTGLLFHADLNEQQVDPDNDGFLNLPLKKQINGLYRLFYENDLLHAQVSVHGISERRRGGQLDKMATPQYPPYKIAQNTDRAEVFAKLAYKGFAEPYRSLGSQWSASYHDLRSNYGNRYQHNGTQRSFYGNVIYNSIFGTTDHKISTGFSGQIDDFKEFINEKNISRIDKTVGVFGEYTYNRPAPEMGEDINDWTIVVGARADYHSRIGGIFITPRLHVKYNFSENTVLRFAGGRGVRAANVLVENIGSMVTNRQIEINNSLKLEDAWNVGLSFVHKFFVGESGNINLSADIYRTDFVNQIVADFDSDHTKIQFYNLNGKSFSNAGMIMLNFDHILPNILGGGLTSKLVFKFNDVRSTFGGKLLETPLVPRSRGLVTLDWKSKNEKLAISNSAQRIGAQRLATTHVFPHEIHKTLSTAQLTGIAPSFWLFNSQISYKFLPNLEFYLGGENLADFRQQNPIISANDPTDAYFDAMQIYAPLTGRRVYGGLRWFLE